jgi:hypothetical protein
MQVVAPSSVCAAVHDNLGLLALGFHGPADVHVALYKLDGNGTPAAGPAQTILPRTESLKQYPHYALALAFHPKLPLLYVWQDIAGPPEAPASNPAYKEFDHLAIYAVNNGQLQLLQSHARGLHYLCGNGVGSLALDPEGKRIFLPNLRHPVSGRPAIGYLALDANGVPLVFEGAETPVIVEVADFRDQPTGMGFWAVSDKVLLASGVYGPLTWDTENRRAALNVILIPGATTYLICGHPKLPLVYGVQLGGYCAFGMEHADGFLTQIPQSVTISGSVAFQTLPVVMTGRSHRLITGGANAIYAVPLDAAGKLTNTVEMLTVTCASMHALAYSGKFDKLYVGVDKAP